MNLLTTDDVAGRLGVSRRRVLALISDGRLPAQKIGRDYIIKDEDLKLVGDRKPGRPPKPKDAVIPMKKKARSKPGGTPRKRDSKKLQE